VKEKFKIGLVSIKHGDGCPPAGIAYIATYLRQRLGKDIDVKIIDQNFDNVEHEIRAGNFDLLGISAMTVHYGGALRLARAIKKEIKVPIVIGGVHISTLPGSFEGCFDIGVNGEGEEAMLEITRLYLDKNLPLKEDLSRIKGLIFLDNKRLVKTEDRVLIENLDSIPRPDWGMVNQKYFSNMALTNPSVKRATPVPE